MSVFIKAVDLPEKCVDCFCFNGEYLRCQISKNGHGFWNDKRPHDCPLVDGEEYEKAFIAQAVRLGFWE